MDHNNQLGSQADHDFSLVNALVDVFIPGAPRSALTLSILAWAGCWIGRGAYTLFCGQPLFPNIFVQLIGPRLAFEPLRRPLAEIFGDVESPPLIAPGGVKHALGLLYFIRDPLMRSEREMTEPGESAVFSRTMVDDGQKERRLLIVQPLARTLAKKARSAGPLVDTLTEAFLGRNLIEFTSLRDGGHLRSSEPHVSLLSNCSKAGLGEICPTFRDLCVFASCDTSPQVRDLAPRDEDELFVFRHELLRNLRAASGVLRVAPLASAAIDYATRQLQQDQRPVAAFKIVKLALLFAVLNGSGTIDERHVREGVSLFQNSERELHAAEIAAGAEEIERAACRIVHALRSQPGMSASALQALFQRNLPSEVMIAAKEKILSDGRAHRVPTRGSQGRPQQTWYPGRGS